MSYPDTTQPCWISLGQLKGLEKETNDSDSSRELLAVCVCVYLSFGWLAAGGIRHAAKAGGNGEEEEEVNIAP
jgi:hypothetical protein